MITPEDPRHGSKAGYNAGCRKGRCPLPPDRDCAHENMLCTKLRRTGRSKPLRSPIGTSNRLRALQAIGWGTADLAARLGVSRDRALQLTECYRGGRVTAATAGRVAALYDRLSMIPGPSRQARMKAAYRGWAPPLAWDDDQLDAPGGRPNFCGGVAPGPEVDHAVVARCLAGERVPANRAERLEVIRRWQAGGGELNELDQRLGWNCYRDLRSERAKR